MNFVKYYPWDRLRLDKKVYDGNSVFKAEVGFDLFKTYRNKVMWNFMKHGNMGLFYGNLVSQRDVFLRNLSRQSSEFVYSSRIDIYDFNSELVNIGEELEEEFVQVNYHHYEDSVLTFLEDVQSFRDEITETMAKNGSVEASGRKVQIIVVHFDENSVLNLKKISEQKILADLLSHSFDERVVVVPVVSKASDFPEELHKLLRWGAYLGTDNDDFVHDLYSELEDGSYSKHQKIIGTLFDCRFPYLVILHPLKFTPSEFYHELENRFAEEDALYRKFLEQLDDGT